MEIRGILTLDQTFALCRLQLPATIQAWRISNPEGTKIANDSSNEQRISPHPWGGFFRWRDDQEERVCEWKTCQEK
jgi:hypothetical protein